MNDPYNVAAIKADFRQALEDNNNSQSLSWSIGVSPEDLTKLLNDHDALVECVAFLQCAVEHLKR